MSSYAAYLNGYRGFVGNPLLKWKQTADAIYEGSHGGLRYFMSQLPFTGKLRQFSDTIRKWEDSYNNTGRDPTYSTTYGNGGIPFVNDAIGTLTKPARMVNTLSKMYGAEIELLIPNKR